MKMTLGPLVACCLALAACTGSEDAALDPAGSPVTNSTTSGDVTAAGLPAPGTVEYFNSVIGDRVFFETDSITINPASADVLSQQATWLRDNPGSTAMIEGHADERGTREYNLALGARRAEAVRSFLVAQGVDAGRLESVSYGKERPVAVCSNESCWSENRRGVTVLAGGPTS
ncbi:MAG: peptidoglycan-associated lipoprotein Pal [Pseudomonadota bacterium]